MCTVLKSIKSKHAGAEKKGQSFNKTERETN